MSRSTIAAPIQEPTPITVRLNPLPPYDRAGEMGNAAFEREARAIRSLIQRFHGSA